MTRAMSSWSGVFVLLLMGTAVPAWAQEEPPGWIPYIELSLDLHQDDVRGEVRSTTFSTFTGNKNYHNTPLGFVSRIGVLTPIIEPLPAKARVFLDVGVYATPEGSEEILDIGNIGVSGTDGRGTKITRKFKNPGAVVGLGMEFTLPFIDERLKLKPSLEYALEKVEITGKLVSVPPVNFRQSVDRTYNSVGMGLEGEFVVTGGLSLYVETRVLWVVNNEKVRFANTPLPNNVQWVYERKDIPVLHGGFGVRYAYRGF